MAAFLRSRSIKTTIHHAIDVETTLGGPPVRMNIKRAPIKSAAGCPQTVISISPNTIASDLDAMEARLKKKESDFDQALKSSRQGMWEWTATDNSFSLSQSWYESLGYMRSELIEKITNLDQLVHRGISRLRNQREDAHPSAQVIRS